MNRSWFGPKNDSGGGTGIASWQGAVVVIACLGGAFAAETLLSSPLRHLAAGVFGIALVLIYCATYDKDAIT